VSGRVLLIVNGVAIGHIVSTVWTSSTGLPDTLVVTTDTSAIEQGTRS
jgi:hypothetical protein